MSGAFMTLDPRVTLSMLFALVAACSGDEPAVDQRSQPIVAGRSAEPPQAAAAPAPAQDEVMDALASSASATPAAMTPSAAPSGAAALPQPAANASSADPTLPAAPSGTPAVDAPAPTADDCEERYSFRAHASASAGAEPAAYRVPAGSEQVIAFYFALPWLGSRQLIKTHFVFDNTKVLHHWAFYGTGSNLDPGAVFDESIFTDAIRLTEAQMIIGGGPRSSDVVLPPDVGFKLPEYQHPGFLLEMHYVNTSDAPNDDTSGIELCMTTHARPQIAAAHALGKGTFTLPAHAESDITTTCEPTRLPEPVHMFAIAPHMHETGIHSTVTVNRAGQQLPLLDEPYDMHNQTVYSLPRAGRDADVLLQPGDTLTTTCRYRNDGDNTIVSGTTAAGEMCMMLVWAWPAGLLHNDVNAHPEFDVPAENSCMVL
jgi:hypothetical protein